MSEIDWKALIEEDGDPFGIKDSLKKKTIQTADDRLLNSFEEINDFIDKNGKTPEESDDILEKSLFYRLKGIKEDYQKSLSLKSYDRHNLLDIKESEIEDSDVFQSNMFDDEIAEDEDIFNLKHVKYEKEREKTDFVSRRKHCKDFDKYEPMFKQYQEDLKNNKRQLEKFDERQIEEGSFFIMHGIMVYIDKLIDIKRVQREYENKYDGRTHLIFENGTESNMRYRSVCKRLFENGYHVSRTTEEIMSKINKETEGKTPTGSIYILKSLSKDETVKNIADLYKIGYCETAVKERIKNASSEPTYLMAPVKVVAEFKTFDMNAQKFELLIHKFFGHCCINIDVYDNNGTRHTTREWFQIPYEKISEAIKLIENGQIVNYKYDRYSKQIIKIK